MLRIFLAVRPGGAHAVLRLAHLAGRHHFHGFGDLLGVFHRFDLVRISLPAAMNDSLCLTSGADQANVFLNAVTAAVQFSLGSFVHSLGPLPPWPTTPRACP
jgi:hypothetical protein